MVNAIYQFEKEAVMETIAFGGVAVRFLVTGDSSNGSVTVFELTVGGGQKLPAPAHRHEAFEETFYGLEGRMTWTVDGVVSEVGAGEALCIRRGAVHRFDNPGMEEAKGLCVITPGVLGPEYFREMHAEFVAAAGGPPDRGKLVEIMRRYGLTVAG